MVKVNALGNSWLNQFFNVYRKYSKSDDKVPIIFDEAVFFFQHMGMVPISFNWEK